eukprot:g11801.t1
MRAPADKVILPFTCWTLLALTSCRAVGADTLAVDNERRTYNGTGNNVDHPDWGSVGQRQLRSLAEASYADGISEPPGGDRPTARELLSEVFLATPTSGSTASALFVGWGLLVGYDLFLHQDNASEPLDIECNDGSKDVWCALGSMTDPIPFDRSDAQIDSEGDRARSPTNYATAYIDLDWIYGRDEEAAAALRTQDGGHLNLTDDELPHLLSEGTWLVADQRPAKLPVTFALMTLLLREHNRCCDEMALEWSPANDEDVYQFCRQWTIAVFQHITENDFAVRLVGGSIKVLGAAAYDAYHDDAADIGAVAGGVDGGRRWLGALENATHSRYLSQTNGTYHVQTDAGVDTVFSTVAIPAFYSALPPTVELLDDNFEIVEEHGVELVTASGDLAGFLTRIGGIEPIIRGAAYARSQAIDVSFAAQVAASSSLFNLPVEVIQRGRDHGIPSYNDAREAYGLSRVSSFVQITADTAVQGLLAQAHGNDPDLLDAYTGALAETEENTALFAGPLLRAIFLEQLYRAIVGDRHHHSHTTENEDASLFTLAGLVLANSGVSTIPLDTFSAPNLVASSNCSSTEVNEAILAEGFKLAWNQSTSTDEDSGGKIYITLSARDIDGQGMLGIGFGEQSMAATVDFVICVVNSEISAVCTDHSGPGGRSEPPLDQEGDTELDFVSMSVEGSWTSVTFARLGMGNDDSDYPLSDDIDLAQQTPIIYAWRSGEGIGKHANSQRGSAQVNFQSGSVIGETCSNPAEYYALHGALLLLAWMLIAPYGIYQARYRKGKKSLIGNLWWEMHQECMIVCAEALLPLAITAVFTTGGPHNSEHAKWGFYMVGAIVLQLATGFARVRALEAKSNNFSVFHRVNKHFHIYAGWFAYLAGLVQCYRGLELVSGTDKLVFSAVEINFTLGNFRVVQSTLFPIWLGIVPPVFFALEVRKQFKRYFTKGAASFCGVVELINEDFTDEAIQKQVEDRLIPRTEELPIYNMQEFNDKILNGRCWVIVDGAVLDVSTFAKRHPGGARIIINTMGTDITAEFLGESTSIGNPRSAFAPHAHTEAASLFTALEIARSLVVGYIEEEDDTGDETDASETEDNAGGDIDASQSRRRKASLSRSGSESDGSVERRIAMMHWGRRSSATTPRASTSSRATTPRAFTPSRAGQTPREPIARLGYPSPFSGTDHGQEPGASTKGSRAAGRDNGVGGGGGGNNSTDDSRPSRLRSTGSGSDSSENASRSLGRRVSLGAGVKLSAEAAAILNAEIPTPSEGNDSAGRSRSKSAPGVGNMKPAPSFPPNPRQIITRNATTPEAPVSTVPPNPRQTITRNATAPEAPFPAVDGPGLQGRPRGLTPHSSSLSADRPLTLDRPVTGRWMEPPLPEKKSIKAVGTRMLKRIGSQLDPLGGTSGEGRSPKQDDRPFRVTRRVLKTRNPLDFFHVCPLLLHEKMCEGNGRPVHKFVFACPEKAAGLVSAMGNGVCHFNMRLAREAGMAVVQRAYNAFAVRVLDDENEQRVVVPASETTEGILCIETRIRLYPDGLMSSLLSQLIKNSDSGRDHNPAVQLQGPFWQSKLMPPPTHRNVIMLSAGTGVNPMLQLIRDYLLVGSNNRDAVMGTHARLVLLWQNSVEGDLYCADELTKLQAKAKGLLEVTALISGDLTRRNVPGNAFRRAKAKLMKKGAGVGLVSTRVRVQPDGEGTDQDEESAGQALARKMPAGLNRLQLGRELSRVSEEDSNFTRASRSSRSMRGGRDLERGGSGGRRDLPWSSSSAKRRNKPGRGGGGGGGGESKTPSGSGIQHPRRGRGVDAQSPVVTDVENFLSEEVGQEGGGGNDNGDTDAVGSDPQRGLPSRRVTRENAARLGRSSGSHSAEIQRSGIHLADSIRAAGVGRGRWSKGAGSKNIDGSPKGTGGRVGGGGGKGKGSHIFSTEYNSSGDRKPEAAAGARRKTKRGATRRRSAGRVAAPAGASPLDDSDSGLKHCKLSREILEEALGEPVLAAVAAANAAAAGTESSEPHPSYFIRGVTSDAHRDLVGTATTGGKLQVVVSGPAGFVFYVEGLLADLCIPPEAVVILD